MSIAEKFSAAVKAFMGSLPVRGTVVSVDETLFTCVVEIDDQNDKLTKVRLCSSYSKPGVVLIPKVDSRIDIAFVRGEKSYPLMIQVSEVEKVIWVIGSEKKVEFTADDSMVFLRHGENEFLFSEDDGFGVKVGDTLIISSDSGHEIKKGSNSIIISDSEISAGQAGSEPVLKGTISKTALDTLADTIATINPGDPGANATALSVIKTAFTSFKASMSSSLSSHFKAS